MRRETLVTVLALLFFLCAVLVSISACDKGDDNDDSGADDDSIADDDAADDDTADDDAADDDTSDDDVGDDDTTPDDDTDDDDTTPGDDDTWPQTHLLPGPDEPGYDAELEAKATLFDRNFHNFNAYAHLINSDVVVPLDHPENRELVRQFLQESDSWDFEAWSGLNPEDIITDNQATAGLYAGVGIAADAYRYGLMRDQGYPEEDVDRAREFLLRGMEGLRIAVEITGVPGVIARGYQRTDVPGSGPSIETTPLFDGEGNPLPPEKNNGTWRDDNSPDQRFPNYVWLDSCSRDQFLGWATAFGAVWEVVKDDPTIPEELKTLHQQYASDLGRNLMVVRPSGFDLEIIDADTRTTYHGYINENNWDRIYLPWLPIKDGSYVIMALGIVASLAYASEDPVLESYLYDTLLGPRHFQHIVYHNIFGVNLGWITNYSSVNMAFEGYLMAQRYIDDEETRDLMRHMASHQLYELFNSPRMPKQYSYSLFDFVYAAGQADATVWHSMTSAPDAEAVARGVQTLKEFPDAPYWEYSTINCDESEIESGLCELNDGTIVHILGYVGRNGDLIAQEPIPQRVRWASNYHWRSNPFMPNGGSDGSRLLPAVDWRWAYWYARWIQ